MKLEQAARQALEALEEIAATRYPSNWCEALHDEITALREALASRCQTTTTEQAEQEPVACIIHTEEGDYLDWNSKGYCFYTGETPLYATPLASQDTHATHVVRTKDPCNPLQDLTDDEIRKLWDDAELDITWFARAVIAADREKNCGTA